MRNMNDLFADDEIPDDLLLAAVDSSNEADEICDFGFPFSPYPTQLNFMTDLYRCIEEKQIGVFESPTGTGKSLSIICSALTWLLQFPLKENDQIASELKRLKNNLQACDEDSNWIKAHEKKIEITDNIRDLETRQVYFNECKQLLEDLFSETGQQKRADGVFCSTQKQSDESCLFDQLFPNFEDPTSANKDDIVLAEYFSDDECDMILDDDSSFENDVDVTKVFFASRTHSQLAQFIREVQKVNLRVTSVTLGSRVNLCINPEVRKLKSLSLVNDRCLQLRKKGCSVSSTFKTKRKKTDCGQSCPFYRNSNIEKLTKKILKDPIDIEDICATGQQLKACPYYACRRAVPLGQLVLLPYNVLLHRETREAFGIKLKENIVVFDEGHNLLDAITSAHTILVNSVQLTNVILQLTGYRDKFKTRLKAKNIYYIGQLIFCFEKFLKTLQTLSVGEERISGLYGFLEGLSLDNMDFLKLARYCERSGIARKLYGFYGHLQEPETKTGGTRGFLRALQTTSEPVSPVSPQHQPNMVGSPLMAIEPLLSCLAGRDEDARIVIKRSDSSSSLKFFLLNPALRFRDLINEPRSLIVTGGTMKPFEEIVELLLVAAGTPRSRITLHCFPHVISQAQILPLIVDHGPNRKQLDFRYSSRKDSSVVLECGWAIVKLCGAIPGGIIVFFPSYDYEQFLYDEWLSNGVISEICRNKRVFREPRNAKATDETLSKFSKVVNETGGAMLFSIIGGKMSEGINFGDNMGRCVIIIGLPYPNKNSLELREKMSFLNKINSKLGQEHYENICMKSVNQSVGRVIRHKNDYASVLFFDYRYLEKRVQSKLPSFIRDSLKHVPVFADIETSLNTFYAEMRTAFPLSNKFLT